jgi:hypothetical protein
VIIPLDLTQLSCPDFMLAVGLPSGFTTDGVGCWGGALWRACNLTSFSPCLTGPVDYLFAFRHKRPRFKSPGGYLCETGILLLAMSRYIFMETAMKINMEIQRFGYQMLAFSKKISDEMLDSAAFSLISEIMRSDL